MRKMARDDIISIRRPSGDNDYDFEIPRHCYPGVLFQEPKRLDPKYIVYSDEKVVIIKDAYPKAKHHYLVIPHEEIAGIKDLKPNHIPLLKHMEIAAEDYISKIEPRIRFKIGYHAKPSMHRLHLHVISTDMQSPALKTKKHWNSFTTEFFLNSGDVINELQTNEKITIPDVSECANILNRHLKCNQCYKEFPNMPKLKAHLVTHNSRPGVSVHHQV